MNKGDFIGGARVCLIDANTKAAAQVMTLGGTADNWVCTWVDDSGMKKSQTFSPEQLQLVDDGA